MISRESACLGKRCYDTKRRARQGRRRTNADDRQHLSIYRCPFCGFYHLGHLPARVREGRYDRQDYRADAKPVTWEDYL